MIISHPNDPLYGITLETVLKFLVEEYGWEELGKGIPINCFLKNPSIKSSLAFLRKTKWARDKVETLYIETMKSKERRAREREWGHFGESIMGGVNHQPCNRFLGRSTQMSLALSLSGISLEQANVHLEHILLKELDSKKANVGDFLSGIGAFKERLVDLKTAIASLRQQMKDENYTDLPTIQSPELEENGKRMSHKGMVSWAAFEDVLAVYRHGSFYSVLECFDEHVDEIDRHAETLQTKAESCAGACDRGQMQNELEENGNGNLRPEFAKLYTSWSVFARFFLASSLVSTEAYYMANGYGTLVPASETSGVLTPT